MFIKLHTSNLHNIENNGIIHVMQTLKDAQATLSLSCKRAPNGPLATKAIWFKSSW